MQSINKKKFDFEQGHSEEYYRKMLLLDKFNGFLQNYHKQYIFNMRYCWDILFKDQDIASLCYGYAKWHIKKPFPKGEPYIATEATYAYYYAVDVLRGPFLLGEKTILESPYSSDYSFLKYNYRIKYNLSSENEGNN